MKKLLLLTLLVASAFSSKADVSYKLATAADLTDGTQFIMVAPSVNSKSPAVATGLSATSNGFFSVSDTGVTIGEAPAYDVTFSDGVTPTVFTVVTNGDGFSLMYNNQYVGAGSGNNVTMKDALADAAVYTFTDESPKVKMTTGTREMAYNSSSPRFAPYNSSTTTGSSGGNYTSPYVYIVESDTPGTETPGPETPGETVHFLNETLANGQGDFTVENTNLPSSTTYIWSFDKNYGYAKATAFYTSTSHAAEAWLISPAVNLSKATAASLSFDQAGNYFTSQDNMKSAVTVNVREVGSETWTALTIPTYPNGTSWTFANTGSIDLSAYLGKTIQIGFRYTSTDALAGTWEVKNVLISGTGEVVATEPDPSDPDTPGEDENMTATLNTTNFGASGNAYTVYEYNSNGVYYTSVFSATNNTMQFNTNNNNGKASAIVVNKNESDYIIESIDVTFGTVGNGVNIYSYTEGFGDLTLATTPTIPDAATQVESALTADKQNIVINAPAFAIYPAGSGVIQVSNVTVHYKKADGDTPGTDTPEQPGDETEVESDVLTNASVAIFDPTEFTSYDFAGKTGTEYQVVARGTRNTIQLRARDNAGIVVTKSVGTAKSVKFTFNSTTAESNGVVVFGSNDPYTSTADLYLPNLTPLTTIAYNPAEPEATYNFDTDYKYIGIRAEFGVVRFDEIDIAWNVTESDDPGTDTPGTPDDNLWEASSLGTADINPLESFTVAETVTFTFEKGSNTSNAPVYKAASAYTSYSDVRTYAGNTITATAAEGYVVKEIVFNLSDQGLKRLAPITASAGTVATQASGDTSVTWTGDVSTVTFTVGDRADFGSESDKAGQLDFVSMKVVYEKGEGSGDTPGTETPGESGTATLNVNDATDIQGTFTEEVPAAGTSNGTAAHYQPLTSFTLEVYTFTFSTTNTNASSQPAYYYAMSTNSNQQKTVRIYNGTSMTITAPEGQAMTKIEFTGSNLGSNAAFTVNNGTWAFSGNNATWTNEAGANAVTVTANATWRFTELVITYGPGSGDTPGTDTPGTDNDILFEESFATSQGDFTIENTTLPSELSYVWQFDSKYGMKASAFANQTSYAADSWLISPVINLENADEAYLSFDHAINKFASLDQAKTAVSVNIRIGSGEWTALTIPNWGTNNDWDFVNSGDIDLVDFVGQNVQIGFHYTSTTTNCGTWEVKNVVISGNGEAGGDTPEQPEQPGDEDNVVVLDSWTTVTWTGDGNGFTGEQKGFTITTAKGSSSNDLVQPDQYSIRVYQGSTLTVTAPEGKTFDKVVFALDAQYSKAWTAAVPQGWTATTGSATDPQFTVMSETGHNSLTITANAQLRVVSITIYLGEGQTDIPEVEVFTVAEALEMIANGTAPTTPVRVEGYITKIDEIDTNGTFGNATYYIGDTPNATSVLEIYRGYGLNGEKFNAAGATIIQVGAKVVVEGVIVDYNGTPEMNSGSTIVSYTAPGADGIFDIFVDQADVEYYNLQGVRVYNPENGVYIRRQGNTVTKVVVK